MSQTKGQAIAGIVSDVGKLNIEELVMWHCYHKHWQDEAAQDACKPEALAATQSLIADLPTLAEGLVAPAFQAQRVEGPAQVGQSRFGGMPDVPADFVWPVSDGFAIRDATVDFEPVPSPTPVALDDPLPLTFVAQIDLSALSPASADLPDTGRLLIFMDYAVWFEGEDRARTTIIWDKTPVDSLTRHDPPEALAWLDALARAKWQEFETDRGDLPGADDGGEPEREPFNSGFMPPAVSVQFAWVWQRLARSAIETARSEYYRRQKEMGAADIYAEVALGYEAENEDDEPPYHQVLGVPFPEQDDPSLDAYYQALLGRPVITGEDYDELFSKIGPQDAESWVRDGPAALNYRLLLQLDVASFLGMNAEGHFYFFLHEDDLAAHNFDAVIVIYQQT